MNKKIALSYIPLLLAAALSNQSEAIEASVIVGLHISHFGNQNYTDYSNGPKLTSKVAANPTTDAYWLAEYETKSYNDGALNNNQLVGVRLEHEGYALTGLTYKNSFYERSFGFCLSKVFRTGQNVTFETGAMLVTGYREAMVMEDKDASMAQKPVIAPMISAAYKITENISMTYSTMTMSVGILGLEYRL